MKNYTEQTHQIKRMVPVYKILGASKKEYEFMVWVIYTNWASIYTKDRLTMQRMIVSKSVAKWFNSEYIKLIKEFKTMIKPYESLDKEAKRKLYVNVVTKIYDRYPKPLIDEYKAIKITNQSYNLN